MCLWLERRDGLQEQKGPGVTSHHGHFWGPFAQAWCARSSPTDGVHFHVLLEAQLGGTQMTERALIIPLKAWVAL